MPNGIQILRIESFADNHFVFCCSLFDVPIGIASSKQCEFRFFETAKVRKNGKRVANLVVFLWQTHEILFCIAQKPHFHLI
jgi:hypothetical protein